MPKIVAIFTLLFLLSGVVVPRGHSEEKESKDKKSWSLKPTGSITNYFIYDSHPFYTSPKGVWDEIAVTGGAIFEYKESVRAEAVLMGVKTAGNDPYNSAAAGSAPSFDIDRAFIQVKPFQKIPLTFSLGRQYIRIGTQFIVGDGILEGFGGATQGVYMGPRLGFDSLKIEWAPAPWKFTALISFVDPSWDPGLARGGTFSGMDVEYDALERFGGKYGGNIFYRSDTTGGANQMGVFAGRGEQHFKKVPGDLYLGGEFVFEYGDCNNPVYCTNPGAQTMNEHAWHVELGYKFTQLKTAPFLEAGYLHHSNDYDPVFAGFNSWGKWYLGSDIWLANFNTNQKAVHVEAGFSPLETLTLRLLYFHTRLVSGPGGALLNEIDLVADWTPLEWLWAALLVGFEKPGSAMGGSGLVNPFTLTPVGTSSSANAVVMTRVSF
ncbi:MAG: hypothetical protein HYU99_08960 [Deltaproteobacteria bacterium]|nr:hypothetical protein [Deltaproteobacteria bacterium]